MRFDEFNLGHDVLDGIEAMRFINATPVQEQAIPIILDNKDLIACAQTGTGKTGAFLIPTVDRILDSEAGKTKCLILVPTRELAVQIDQFLEGLSYYTAISHLAVYGGNDSKGFSAQKQALIEGADIIIATPGRFLQHINLGYVDLSEVKHFILDEADRMLDMGFVGDILKISETLPKERQSLMFSATMASEIRKLATTLLKNPEQINLSIAKPAAGINQQAYMVYDENKIELLKFIIAHSEVKSMIVFASKKVSVDDIHRTLKRAEYSVKALHSGKSQQERNETMRQFKANKFSILIATDILSRGIDIDDLSHVVNYDIPDDAADYVHRIGRTARAGKNGAAISFINPKDQYKFYNIEQLIEREIEKLSVPSEIGKSPTYDPKKKSGKGGGKGRSFKGKGGPRKGGNFKGKKDGKPGGRPNNKPGENSNNKPKKDNN